METETVRLTIRVPAGLRDAIKIRAVQRRESMESVAVEALARVVDDLWPTAGGRA